jgi:GTP-binding protein
LIDIRHEPQKIDLEFMEFLGENHIPFCIIFTKSDKLAKTKIHKNVKNYEQKMLEKSSSMPNYFITSSVDKNGKESVLNFISETNLLIKSENQQ